jgi:hypothetical protein
MMYLQTAQFFDDISKKCLDNKLRHLAAIWYAPHLNNILLLFDLLVVVHLLIVALIASDAWLQL